MICVSFGIFMAVNLYQNYMGFSGKPGALQSLGLHRVRDTATATAGGSVVKNPPSNVGDSGFNPWTRKIPWRRKWQPPPVFLPEKFHGQRWATVLGVAKSQKRLSTHTHVLISGIDQILSKFPLKWIANCLINIYWIIHSSHCLKCHLDQILILMYNWSCFPD